MEQHCPVCFSDAKVDKLGPLNTESEVLCKTCGYFIITDDVERQLDEKRSIIAPWLFYHAKYNKSECISVFKIYDGQYHKSDVRYVSLEQIANWYPRTFIEKADQFIQWLARVSEVVGDVVMLRGESATIASFGKIENPDLGESKASGDTASYYIFVKRLVELGYLTPDSSSVHIALSAKGWIRVDELRKNDANNRDIFIAMDFDDAYAEIADAIKKGIIDAKFNPVFMKDIIHNKQIVPMMFRLIRESKLLVMDVTYANLGAYHEAGYALGLGKEVIISCREEEFNDPKNKPHFDIAQKQILVWKDYADLTERLSEWIKAIAG